MLFNQKILCQKLDVTIQTLNMYLCRSEFAHIKRIRKNKLVFYENVSMADIARLKDCIRNQYNRGKQWKIKKEEKKEFICPCCGKSFVFCDKIGYKTSREIELENELKLLAGQNKALLKQNKSLQKVNSEFRKIVDKK